MGKVKWGLTAAVVVAILVALWFVQGPFRSGGETAAPDSTAADVADGADAGANDRSPASSADTSDDGNATGSAGTGEEADTGEATESGDENDAGDVAVNTGGDTDDGSTRGSAASFPEADGGAGGADSESEKALQEEAESYVRQLADPSDEPLRVERAEGFVGGDRPLAMAADGEAETGVLPEAEPVEDAAQEEPAVADSGPGEAAQTASPEDDALEQPAAAAEGGGSAPAQADEPETGATLEGATAVSEAGATGVEDVASGDTGVESARPARADLPLSEEAPVTIAELLDAEDAVASDAVFYVHTVRPEDNQGIWGIVHDGIVKNFAAGVAVHRGEQTETYQVDIPRNADEPRSDSSSSFLGRLIYQKSRQTYVYNYRTDRLGRNPDLIYPGQEIVIVSFSPEELVEIYKHFVREDG
ncbi:MAG TPA: hypothetical protein VK973_11835 [Arenicellales bacterium]|nr:hypothetical protein [Arenicellales bacterium]